MKPNKKSIEKLARKMHSLVNEMPVEETGEFRKPFGKLSDSARGRYLYVARRMIEEGMVK